MNKSVIVTGGAKGIGGEIAKRFAKGGYNVFINYLTSEKEAINLKKYLINTYSDIKVEIYKADVSKSDEVKEMLKFMLEKFGSIDVVVNNAGVALTKLFNDISENELKYIIDTNLFGTFNVSQQAIKLYMLNNKSGSIINISSIWGISGASMEVAYSTTKSAIIGMSKALAKEMRTF